MTYNSSFQNYPHRDRVTQEYTDTPGFKPFALLTICSVSSIFPTIQRQSQFKIIWITSTIYLIFCYLSVRSVKMFNGLAQVKIVTTNKDNRESAFSGFTLTVPQYTSSIKGANSSWRSCSTSVNGPWLRDNRFKCMLFSPGSLPICFGKVEYERVQSLWVLCQNVGDFSVIN